MKPPHNGSRTSKAAARAIIPHTAKQRKWVFAWIKAHHGCGITREQIGRSLGLSGDSVRPRVWELMRQGLVYEKGQRRTRAGRMAAVLFAK